MAPRRGKQSAKAGSPQAGGSRRSVRIAQRASGSKEGVPEVFAELVAESGPPTRHQAREQGRPWKRRKVGLEGSSLALRKAQPASEDAPKDTNDAAPPGALFSAGDEIQEEIIVEEEEESAHSEMEWEEVDLEAAPTFLEPTKPAEDSSKDQAVLTIDLNAGATPKRTTNRIARRPLSAAEKQLRLTIHKVHLLCLLSHVSKRNHLCNDSEAQAVLKRLLPPTVITELHVEPRYSQMQRTKAFTQSLEQIVELWHQRFKITATGLRKPKWAANLDALKDYKLPETAEDPVDRADFRRAAKSLEGSVDLGAQLFCCLLRAVSIKTRLVCSLQPLSLGSSAAPNTPQDSPVKRTPRNGKTTIYLNNSEDEEQPAMTRSARVLAGSVSTPTAAPSTPQRVSRMGQRPDITPVPTHSTVSPSRKVPRPVHPVYWVEAFNPAYQKWLSIDALCTKTVNKPSHLAPAHNDPQNNLAYAVAFNEDGTARDVTLRYTHQYNAKVRKLRVEVTDGGSAWWTRAMRCFRFPGRPKRDWEEIEDAELKQKLAREGMPSNISDFKGHPLFVLERHLKTTEVIHPRHVVGKVNAGTNAKPRMEDVFRRSDVHVCRSADKWFRLGREVKVGEKPVRHAKPRRRDRRSGSPDGLGEGVDVFGEEVGAGLYALFQTQVYVPPPVVSGKVPRNAYGNLDVYVSSMVPRGGVHVRHPDAKSAAKILGIDFAEAVVGFKFQGRKGTAVTLGVVVAAEYAEAMATVIQGLQEEQESQMEAKRSFEMLRLWKKFLVGLRVAERMKKYKSDFGDDGLDEVRDEDHDLQKEIDEEMDRVDELGQAGGFFPDQDQPAAPPVSIDHISSREESTRYHPMDNIFDFGITDLPERSATRTEEDHIEAGGFLAKEAAVKPVHDLNTDVDIHGGGFVDDEPLGDEAPNANTSDMGGGFLVDEDVNMNGDSQSTPNLPKEVEPPPPITNHNEVKKAALQNLPTQNSKEPEPLGDSNPPDTEVEGAVADHPDKTESNNLDAGVSQDLDAEMQDLDIDPNIPVDTAQEKLDEMLEEAREETHMNVDSDEDLDHGSLPSHDPEDEDADPEWIY